MFDVYQKGSIQDTERVNPSSELGVTFRTISSEHKVKALLDFLAEAQNKILLIEFIREEWKSSDLKSVIGSKKKQKKTVLHVVFYVSALIKWECRLLKI